MYICICHAVTDKRLRVSIQNGATTVAQLQRETACGTGCGCCLDHVEALLHSELAIDGVVLGGLQPA